jgi:hypothetical protein
MEKKYPTGMGIWIAFGNMIPGGLPEIVRWCKEIGASWVAPRMGHGNLGFDTFFNEKRLTEFINLCHKENLSVYPWMYTVPRRTKEQVDLFKRTMACGADGFILKVEVEYKNNKEDAKLLVTALREADPTAYISNVPLANIMYHLDYPYVEFGELDSTMPQLYPSEFNRDGMKPWADRYDKQWGDFRKKYPSTCKDFPISSSYGRKELLGKVGAPPPGEMTVADLEEFLKRYAGRECYSLYSLEVMGKEIYEYLKQKNIKEQQNEKDKFFKREGCDWCIFSYY